MDFSPAGRLGHGFSALVVYGGLVLVLGIAATLVVLAIENRRRRRAEQRAFAGAATSLRQGSAMIAGTVETDGPEPAIDMRMQQTGHDAHRRGAAFQQWIESSRQITVRAFTLLLDSGERVRVHPDERALVVDRLETTSRPALNRRERSARVSSGDRVFVTGLLAREAASSDAGARSGGYRGGSGSTWVLRAPRRERMLLAANGDGIRYANRTMLQMVALAVLAIGSLVYMVATSYGPFLVLDLFGTPVQATVTELRQLQHDPSPYVVVASALLPSGRRATVSDATLRDTWSVLHAGDSVPFVVLAPLPFVHQIGTAPGVFLAPCCASPFLLFGMAFALTLLRWMSRPWYERRLFTETAAGRLADDFTG